MSDLGLIDAVKNGNYSAVEALLKSGADVNLQDDLGWAPLNFAAGKGDLPVVKLLVENGANIFNVGRDQRTPYKIALAAGRVPVVKYLRELEDNYPGEKPERTKIKYCKAYHLSDLTKYPGWIENPTSENGQNGKSNGSGHEPSTDRIVFIHQDFTVTESVYSNEKVIFDAVDSAWMEFCADSLKFKIPDDLDLMVPNEANA